MLIRFALLLHAVAVIAGFAAMIGCTCSDALMYKAESPDHALVATAFERDCGATTDFSRIVTIGRPSDNYKEERNIVFVVKGQHPVNLKWTAPRKLDVECLCPRRSVFRQVTALGDIDISYTPFQE